MIFTDDNKLFVVIKKYFSTKADIGIHIDINPSSAFGDKAFIDTSK
jgi:hypothetical protein